MCGHRCQGLGAASLELDSDDSDDALDENCSELTLELSEDSLDAASLELASDELVDELSDVASELALELIDDSDDAEDSLDDWLVDTCSTTTAR